MSKTYLDRIEFHDELTICKKQDALTDRALTMFQTLAKETSRVFYFNCDEDRKDAIAVAMHDLFKYWRNFKESNVVQLKINRNFQPVESIIIYIHGHGRLRYIASRQQKPEKRMFLIGNTINNSLKNLTDAIEQIDGKVIAIYTDKIKNKITLMDKFNGKKEDELRECKNQLRGVIENIKKNDVFHLPALKAQLEKKKIGLVEKINNLNIKSFVVAKSKLIKAEIKSNKEGDKGKKTIKKVYLVDPNLNSSKDDEFYYKFKDPPNAFSYFTTMVRMGILKSINKINPKHFRSGNKISIDSVNSENNGMFSL